MGGLDLGDAFGERAWAFRVSAKPGTSAVSGQASGVQRPERIMHFGQWVRTRRDADDEDVVGLLAADGERGAQVGDRGR